MYSSMTPLYYYYYRFYHSFSDAIMTELRIWKSWDFKLALKAVHRIQKVERNKTIFGHCSQNGFKYFKGENCLLLDFIFKEELLVIDHNDFEIQDRKEPNQ